MATRVPVFKEPLVVEDVCCVTIQVHVEVNCREGMRRFVPVCGVYSINSVSVVMDRAGEKEFVIRRTSSSYASSRGWAGLDKNNPTAMRDQVTIIGKKAGKPQAV